MKSCASTAGIDVKAWRIDGLNQSDAEWPRRRPEFTRGLPPAGLAQGLRAERVGPLLPSPELPIGKEFGFQRGVKSLLLGLNLQLG